jgi:hypothetical protein
MILPGEKVQMRVSTSIACSQHPQISPPITVSGHMYGVDSGRVTTVPAIPITRPGLARIHLRRTKCLKHNAQR